MSRTRLNVDVGGSTELHRVIQHIWGCVAPCPLPSEALRARRAGRTCGSGRARRARGASGSRGPRCTCRSRGTGGSDLGEQTPVGRTGVGLMSDTRLNADVGGSTELHRVIQHICS